uniref:Uncharacterized protein n=1 Tax=Myoviridae sp. ctIty1 TaxID=2827673 RepID=A0A8S5TGQ1_9CAUD|nr:MAG TPA: hypothetical protein [Myoviridae sp. ctIty1]
MLKDDFFNAISESCEYDAILDMVQENRDMLLWMYENGYISQEYFEEAENSGNDQWRLDNITAIKANLKKFKDYANNQGKQNNEWLIQNRDYIIDQQKYPVKSGANIQNAPTYTTAFARIKKPLSSNISGIDIKRVTILDTKANNLQGDAKKQADYKNNLWFKKMLVTDYNGQGPFDKFARDYYYGIDKKVNLQSQDIQQLLPKAYNFCTTYNALIKSLETDVNGIINYINKNPITGNQEPTLSQAQLAANKNASDVNKSNTQGMATKPVNADTDYSLFVSTYFKDLLSEDDQTKTSTATPKMSFSSNSSNGDNNQDDSNQPQNQNKPKQDPEDSETVVYNKKKLVCDILKQALNAKMTAAGMLYRDLFSYMQSHVNSYSKKTNQNQNNQKQQQEKLNTNPNKQSTDQNNTQNGGE